MDQGPAYIGSISLYNLACNSVHALYANEVMLL